MSLSVTTQPAAEPVTRAEAKTHLRVTGSDEDSYIDGLIIAARQYCENMTGQAFVERGMQWRIDRFPCLASIALIIPAVPVISIDSIVYTNDDGEEETWTEGLYNFVNDSMFPRLVPAYEEGWPSNVRNIIGAVKINFTAGYEPSEASPVDHAVSVPAAVKHAIKLIIGHLYEHRMDVSREQFAKMPLAADHLLSPYKIRSF